MKIQFLCLWMAVVAGVAMCFGQTSSTTPRNVPADEQAIIDLEKAVTEAYKNKKADVFRKYLAKNYVGINADGTTKRTSEAAEMQNTDLRNYSFTDMKVVFPKAGVAVVTYKTTVESSSAAGQDTSGTYNAASVWTKRWGNWVLISHAFIKSQ
jgi:ketosteroid isomerase-like protein